MRCTGQSPNSALLGEFIPEALDQWGFVKVQTTTQVDAGDSTRKTDNIYVVGDVRSALPSLSRSPTQQAAHLLPIHHHRSPTLRS